MRTGHSREPWTPSWLGATVAGIAVIASASAVMLGASAAQADSIWVQSYQRASQSEECVAPAWETPWQATWGSDSSWKPSYEMWANGGAGGWTCTRSITWAKSPVEGGTSSAAYAVGDVGPAGGTIFYVAPSQQAWGRYLEAALTDIVAPLAWCNLTTSIPGATGTDIGTGAANTAAMDAACSSGAGQAASDYSFGGYDDWFLPSTRELRQLCVWAFADPTDASCPEDDQPWVSMTSLVNGNFSSTSFYWSSSQVAYQSPDAWSRFFADGGSSRDGKQYTNFRARVIRAF